jgi:hypothetical protein
MLSGCKGLYRPCKLRRRLGEEYLRRYATAKFIYMQVIKEPGSSVIQRYPRQHN